MKYKVRYTKTVVLTTEFELELPKELLDDCAEEHYDQVALDTVYDMDADGDLKWETMETQEDEPTVTRMAVKS